VGIVIDPDQPAPRPAVPVADDTLGDMTTLVQLGVVDPDPVPSPNPPAPPYDNG
jgi:hypothetical protein